MKTKSKIAAGFLVTLLGATVLSAQMMPQQEYNGMHKMKGSHSSMYKTHKKGFMPLLYKLNLSEEQQTKVQKIVMAHKQNMPSMYSAFSADAFDKEAYVKAAMTKKENMIKLRAQMISDIYEVLTTKQKSQLRVLMDLKEERMKEGCQFDKNSNGRR